MRLGRDGIAGLIGLAASLALLPFAFGLPKLPIVPIGPGFYPAMVLIFAAAMSAVLLVQDFVAQRQVPTAVPDDQPVPEQPTRAYGLVLASFIAVAIYILLLPLLGYRISTALFVAGFQAVLERPTTMRQWAGHLAVAAGTAAVTFVVFEHYLLVILPRGSWTGW